MWWSKSSQRLFEWQEENEWIRDTGGVIGIEKD